MSIRVTSQWQGKLIGLCGNFDDNSQNDLQTRDGVLASSTTQFGNSWKVALKPCSDYVDPEFPTNACEVSELDGEESTW